jgi:hypothetical protein
VPCPPAGPLKVYREPEKQAKKTSKLARNFLLDRGALIDDRGALIDVLVEEL